VAVIQFVKQVLSLPAQLEPNTVYFVRVGAGFDLYLSDATGSVAHAINSSASSGGQTYQPPLGQVSFFARKTAPIGWLVCDGRALNKQQFSQLYDVIGGLFGETSTTFRLPNLVEQFVRGSTSVGRIQENMISAHAHYAGTPRIWDAAGGYFGSSATTVQYPLARYAGGVTNAYFDLTSSVGGTETRPKNIALLPAIYAGLYILPCFQLDYAEQGYAEE